MLTGYRNNLEQLKGKQENALETFNSFKNQLSDNIEKQIIIEKAQLIIQEVGQKTQSELKIHISNIVTMALESVFSDPYQFKLDFILKRGQTEAIIKFVRNGYERDPLVAIGVGVIDIASFALRIALWSISSPRPTNTLIFDEPFKFLSRELQPRAGEMLQQISKKLGIQIILVTHSKDLIDSADKVFSVSQRNGRSVIQDNK